MTLEFYDKFLNVLGVLSIHQKTAQKIITVIGLSLLAKILLYNHIDIVV